MATDIHINVYQRCKEECDKTKRKVVGPPRRKRENTRSERKVKKEFNWAKEKRKKINRLKARKRNVNSGLNNGLNCESDVFWKSQSEVKNT